MKNYAQMTIGRSITRKVMKMLLQDAANDRLGACCAPSLVECMLIGSTLFPLSSLTIWN